MGNRLELAPLGRVHPLDLGGSMWIWYGVIEDLLKLVYGKHWTVYNRLMPLSVQVFDGGIYGGRGLRLQYIREPVIRTH